VQLPLFDIPCPWTPPDLGSLPSWAGAKRVAFDCETRDPSLQKLGPGAGRRPDSYIVGFCFAIEDGPAAYLPIRHAGGDNLPAEAVLRYVRDQAKVFEGDLVGANLGYDLDFSAGEGIEFTKVRRFRDVQIADPLIYELHDKYGLDDIAKRWGLEGKHDQLLNQALGNYGLKVDSRRDLWKLPGRFVGEYGEYDARLPLAVLRRQERVLEDEDLWRVYELESQLLPILTRMRRRGVRVNLERLAKIEQWAWKEEAGQLAFIKDQTGVNIAVGDVWKPEVLAPALHAIGFTPGSTSQGKPNIDKAVLKSINHPVAVALSRARKVNKLRTTFVGSIREHITSDGRIHCTYNQVRRQREEADDTEGAAYGRLSCVNPNLQQQPSRDDFAPMWRAVYLPEDGDLWAACDYSQQEPRMAVHYSCLAGEAGLIPHFAHLKAIEARDKYRTDPNTDNHQMMADMANIKRRVAKDIFLGLCYGMGGAKLCDQLGLPTRTVVRSPQGVVYDVDSPEGKRLLADGGRRFRAAGVEGQLLLDKFDAAVPFIRKLAWAAERRAKAVGYVVTLSGRRCHFPKDPSGNYDWTHKALNRIIQGSSGDQMKWAMVALESAGHTMIIQVHDETGISARDEAHAKAAAQVMLDCCPLEVPSKVDVEMGESWGGSMGWREAA